MELAGWNQRLAHHFGALARDRDEIPLFALEHGLAPAEVLALSDRLRAHILTAPPSREHSLVWVTYAAEIGYGYAGDEYWQTFEAATPGWTEKGNRCWIRDEFVAFQKRFGAARPSGPWAEQFSIIAWPITHAILPRDLQQQLARILYDLRHLFSAELFDEPRRLGEFIAARSWNASARFRNLVQAPALVGQITAALLLQGEEGFKSRLHPMTLRRISDDVNRERRGRDWLRAARRAAEERAKIRGATIRPRTTTIERRDEARAEVERLGVEPRLVLRPIEGSRWEVSLEVPDLSHLLLRFPQLRDALAESRCTVAGAAGRPLARGRCLNGTQRVALSCWPRPDEVLLKFERTEPQLEFLLRTECLLRPGTSWLFKIGSDGLAYESRAMRVRAGSKYIFVSTEPLAQFDLLRQVEVNCQGVRAVLLDVPPALTPEWEQTLRRLQVTQARSIEVWPAGLAAVAWDGEGYGEWLASDTPILAIRSDHWIDELTIMMEDGGPSLSLRLTDTPPGDHMFIELPLLSVGLHKFSVAARGGRAVESEAIGDLDIVMRVREARPWSPGLTTHGPLDVELGPVAPSLEEFWEGKVAIVVRGPAGRQVKCRVKMFAHAGATSSFERQLPPVTLPLSGDEWTRHFETNLKEDQNAQSAYDDAHNCEVEFSADELGSFTLCCEREFTPLRWSLRRDTSGYIARLHDDAGSGILVTEYYSFERPTVGEKLPHGSEHKAPHTGGLYIARLGEFRASIIVPPVVRELADLGCDPRVEERERTPPAISRLLSHLRIWAAAHLSGNLITGFRQRTVIRAITAHIFAVLGGQNWERAEGRISEPDGLSRLKQSISQNRHEAAIGETLHMGADKLADASPGERTAFLASLAENFRLVEPIMSQRMGVRSSGAPRATVVEHGPEHPTWLAEFALRLASEPMTLEAWAGEHVDASIRKLLDVPTLARAARFLVLVMDVQNESDATAGELYAGWRWSP